MRIAPDWQALLRQHQLDTVAGVYRCTLGTVVAGSGTTETRQLELKGDSQSRPVYVKKYWYPTFWRRLRAVGRGTLMGSTKVRREYDNLLQLRAWGLDAPHPIAWGEERTVGWLSRSLLITESVPSPVPLHEYLSHVLPAIPLQARASKRRELIQNLARYTQRLHHHQFAHHDLFWRNIILSGASLEKFFLIDAHKGGCWKPNRERHDRAQDLACLDAAAPWFFQRSERLRFYLVYAAKTKLERSDKEFLRRVLDLADPMRPKQVRRALSRRDPSMTVPGLLRPVAGSNASSP